MTYINKCIPLDWLLNEILEHTPEAFGVFDRDDKLVFCNQAMAEAFAIPKEQAIGKSNVELMKHAYFNDSNINIETEDIDAWIADIRSRQRQQKHRVFESDGKDGTWRQISELLIDNDLLVVSSSDITELKQAQIELARALETISEIAAIDELTQVNNRRSFNELACIEVKKSKRYDHPLSLILLDIDHFKQVNDTYGHANGDLVLQEFAHLFKENLRDTDLFARFGGEEFVALLPETKAKEAWNLANRLSQLLAKKSIALLDDEGEISITVSSGLCQLLGNEDSLENMLVRADKALYQSKQTGRNRCTLYGNSF